MEFRFGASDKMVHVACYGMSLHEKWRACRIWIEDEKGVRFVKNKFYGLTSVDLKEFFYIKLKAQLRGS